MGLAVWAWFEGGHNDLGLFEDGMEGKGEFVGVVGREGWAG